MKYIKQFIIGIALIIITAFAVTANGQARNPYMPSQGGTGTSTNPTYGQVLVGNAQGTYTLTATSSLGITGSGGSSQWTTNGSDIYYNTGNVGISTTTPGQKLSVGGDILGNNIIGSYFTSTSTTVASVLPYASTTAFTSSGSAFISATSASGSLVVGTTTTGAGARMVIAAGVNPIPFILDSTAATGMYTIYRNSSSDFGYIGAGAVLFPATSGAIGELSIRGTSAVALGIGTSERMRVASTGNVGVGTSSPYSKLSVAGQIVGQNFMATSTTATSTIQGTTLLSADGTYISGATGNSPLIVYSSGYPSPFQIKVVNRSTSPFALAGMTVAGDKYVDNGFSSSYYAGLYFANSLYSVPGFDGVQPNGAALVVSDGPLTLGSATSSAAIPCGVRIQAGGFGASQLDGCISGTTGNWGLGGTTTPYALLSVHQYAGKTSTVLFAVASSTPTATTTLFQIDNTGTTTAANGFNITNGCFSINGSCVGGSGGSGTVGSGTAGQTTYYAGAGTTLTATSSVFINSSTSDVFIGTTTAGATAELTVHNRATRTNIIQGYSAAGAQAFAVLNNGNTSQSGSITAVSGANALTLDSSGFSMTGGSVIPRILFGAANLNSPRLARANLTSSVLLLNNGSGTQTAGGFSVGSSTPTAFVTFSTSSPATVNNWLFAIGTTTTNVSTSTSFLIDGFGQVGIGTSTNAGTLSIESNSGTTTVYVGSSAKPSCVQYYAQNGTAYRQYMSNAGTLTTEAGACK